MDAEMDLLTFIGAAFCSVWTLELLCHLRRHAGESRSPAQLVDGLRASDLIVRKSLAELAAARLVSIDPEGRAHYAPATRELERLAGAADAYYAKSPDAVRRIISAAARENPDAPAK